MTTGGGETTFNIIEVVAPATYDINITSGDEELDVVASPIMLAIDGVATLAPPDPDVFTASCPDTLAVGACACVDATVPTTGMPAVRAASALDRSTLPAVGIVTAKFGPTLCQVRRAGTVTLSGLVAGRNYGVGSDGAAVPLPIALSPPWYLQNIGTALTTTQLLIRMPSVLTLVQT